MYKLVNESLFEFQKGLDPVESLGMGRRAMIKDWLDSMYVDNYNINDDNTIDIYGSIILDNIKLIKFPDYIQFRKVRGVFSCSHNLLTSLRGCPIRVDGSFYCDENELLSLDGAPKVVEGSFYCEGNIVNFTIDDVKKVCKVKGYINVQNS